MKDVVSFTRLQRLRWMRLLKQTDDARNTKKMYKANLHYEIVKRRTKARWKDNVAKDITKRETLLSRPANARYIYIYIYTGCHRRNGPNFGRVFLM